MIDERSDWNQARELGSAAVVVTMKVSDQEIVNPPKASVLCSGEDPPGIAPVVSGIAGVDEHRLASWRDNQRRLAAFDVDEIDVQRLGSEGRREERCRQDRCADESSHAWKDIRSR